MKFNNLIPLIGFVCLSFSCSLITTESSFVDLDSKNKEDANLAYKNFYKGGMSKIGTLINYTDNLSEYKGDIYMNALSSYRVDEVSVAIISMYLIEAILQKKEVPYLSPFVLSKSSKEELLPKKNSEEEIQHLSKIYKNWYDTYKEEITNPVNTEQIPAPLSQSNFYWYGQNISDTTQRPR